MVPLLVHDGGVAGIGQLAAWAAAQGLSGADGDRTVVPGLGPGAWSLCVVSAAELQLVLQGLALPARCRTAVLSSGSVAALELPGPSACR